MLHRDTRELLAAASFFTEYRVRQDDINILELRAVQTAVGLMLAVRAGEAKQLTEPRANDFTRSELRTLKTKLAACTHRWEDGS